MERKIGEIFTYKNKTYQVVEVEIDEECKGCAFEFSSCCTSLLGDCSPTHRTDGASVIFKAINNIKNNQLTIDIPEGMEIDLENSDLSKEKVKILNTIRKLEAQKCVKNIKVGDCFIEEDIGETTEIFQVLDIEEEEVVTCLVVGRYNIYKNSFKVTDTKYWKPITRNQFNSLYQAVLIDLNDSKYHLEHNTNWDKEIKNFL